MGNLMAPSYLHHTSTCFTQYKSSTFTFSRFTNHGAFKRSFLWSAVKHIPDFVRYRSYDDMFQCICGAFDACDEAQRDGAKYFAANVTWEAIETSWETVNCDEIQGESPTCAGKKAAAEVMGLCMHHNHRNLRRFKFWY